MNEGVVYRLRRMISSVIRETDSSNAAIVMITIGDGSPDSWRVIGGSPALQEHIANALSHYHTGATEEKNGSTPEPQAAVNP